LAVVGESGCGKSTLARMVALIEPPTGGTPVSCGASMCSSATTERKASLRKTVQLVFQNPHWIARTRASVSARSWKRRWRSTPTSTLPSAHEKARAMLAIVGLRPEHYDRYPHMFSGGQRQRIAIARALMLEPDLVVADEPVSRRWTSRSRPRC